MNEINRKKVYDFLKIMPKNKVVTYGDLASILNINTPRVIGHYLKSNPDPGNIPCFKVVNAKGQLSHAFAFGGVDKQRELLEKSGIFVHKNNSVDLNKYSLFF